MRSRRSFLVAAGLVLMATTATVGVARAGNIEVKLTLPVRARLDLANRHTLLPAPFIVVRQANDYLHFMQMYGSGPLHTTTILAREAQDGRLMAVHTRHEYTDVAIPGFTSRPEMYIGDCEVS